jgi:hypothetical protein
MLIPLIAKIIWKSCDFTHGEFQFIPSKQHLKQYLTAG